MMPSGRCRSSASEHDEEEQPQGGEQVELDRPMWSTSPQFSAQVRWMTSLGFLLYVGYLALFRCTVKDDGVGVTLGFRFLSFVASSCFLTSGTINWLFAKNLQSKKLAEQSPDLHQYAAGSYSIIELVVVVNLMAGVSHGLMAFELMPVHVGIGSRAFETARFAEWLGCIPIMVVLMHTLEDPRCAPIAEPATFVPFALWPWPRRWAPRELVMWLWQSPHARVWRAVLSMTGCTALGTTAAVWDVGAIFSCLLNLFAVLLFFRVFAVLGHLIKAALAKAGSEADDERHRKLQRESTVHKQTQETERDRAARCVTLCFICCVTWSLTVLVYFGGLLGLYSITVERFSHTCLDLVSKSLYATAVGHSYVNVVSPEVLLEKIISIERSATDQRRRFLRYVMHEVRVPLNTVHLGVQTVIHLDEIESCRKTSKIGVTNDDTPLKEVDNKAGDVVEESTMGAIEAQVRQRKLSLENGSPADEDDGTDRRSVLDLVSRAIETMTATLDDTLSFAAIEEGHFELHLASFAILSTLALALDLFKAAAKEKGVTLVFTTSGEKEHLKLLFGDGRRLASVVNNFVSNALKFTRKRGSKITLNVACDCVIRPSSDLWESTPPPSLFKGSEEEEENRSSSPLRCKLRVEVVDEGVGISEEDQGKLFEPFSQIRPGELQEGRGSGLGLAISKKIVELHGGEVGVRSVLGTGSTFYFHVTLPIVEVDAEEEVTPAATTKGICYKETAPLRPSSKVSPAPLAAAPLAAAPLMVEESKVAEEVVVRRALVVDDVFMNRKLLALSLKREGFECTLAADGQIALAAFEADRLAARPEDRFCLICIDAVMPVMGGLEATREIRKAGYQGLIIGCTGNALAEDIATFIEAGADSVVTKPISLLQLREVIEKKGLGTQLDKTVP